MHTSSPSLVAVAIMVRLMQSVRCVCVCVCVFGRHMATPSRSISPVKVATGKVYL